jgi:hypothetical protein
VIDNMVWIDSWSSIVGAGCGLIALVQVKSGRERSVPCRASKEKRDK